MNAIATSRPAISSQRPPGGAGGAGMASAPALLLMGLALGLCLLLLAPATAARAGSIGSDTVAHNKAVGDDAAAVEAVRHALKNNWKQATKSAARARDPVAEKLVTWLYLTQGQTPANFEAVRDFTRWNGDWPLRARMRLRAEEALTDATPAAVILDWFQEDTPHTLKGAARYIHALESTGQTDKARDFARNFWRTEPLDKAQMKGFRKDFGRLLTIDDHIARLDFLLWNRDFAAARDIMPQVPEGNQILAKARMALAEDGKDASYLVERVPAGLKKDAGLTYDRLRWRRKKEMYDGAFDMAQKIPDNPPFPEKWWKERHILAREAIQQKKYQLAYDLAARHGLKEGADFAEAEFLAGWIALRFLENPRLGFDHFYRLYASAKTPITQARAGYWAGRAGEVLAQPEVSRKWYESSARYPFTFYGQLAGEKLGKNLPLPRRVPATISQTQRARFADDAFVKALRLLDKAGASDEATGAFFRALSRKAKTAEDYALTAELAQEMGQKRLAVQIAKDASKDGHLLLDISYPVLEAAQNPPALETALVHAVIRQESLFDKGAVSSAGALGLMQLMPATAKQVAERKGLNFSKSKLTQDERYNVALGSTYLKKMLDRFDGSHVLAIAAYNAGPARVSGWLDEIGHPGRSGQDIIDWVEMIPVYETRNYVQRVLENYYVYRVRLSQEPATILAMR